MHVFVYGTLKSGFPNHHLLPPNATLVGPASSTERRSLVVATDWFTPILLAEPGVGRHVRGELYKTDADGIAELDQLEGVGLSNGFDRTPIEVDLHGERLEAWTYTKPRHRVGIIHDGPLPEYRIDPRYVPGEDRNAPNRGLGT